MKPLLLAACLALASCGGGSSPQSISTPPAGVAAWDIGPIIGGINYSVGVPPHPVATPDGFAIDLPQAGGHLDYVTEHYGRLTGRSQIVMHYRIDMAPGVQVEPTNYPINDVSELTLYFQRRGDNWSAKGKYEAYRWYATFATDMPITAGEHVLTAPLTGNWTAVLTSSAATNPAGFKAAIDNAESVGFVFGGGTGVGHGVFATGPARITVTGFEIQ